jgi:hypothetical protein
MLITQEMWKNLLNHSNLQSTRLHCVLMYLNKCKMQPMSNYINILKVHSLTHVHMLIIEKI